jgi:hypothetical protein
MRKNLAGKTAQVRTPKARRTNPEQTSPTPKSEYVVTADTIGAARPDTAIAIKGVFFF